MIAREGVVGQGRRAQIPRNLHYANCAGLIAIFPYFLMFGYTRATAHLAGPASPLDNGSAWRIVMSAGGKFDFFLSRRGSVGAVAQEVAGVLTEEGYRVVVQDYDIPFTANFIERMHEAIKNTRDLIVLYRGEYETSPYTRKEFTNFEADRAQSAEERRVIILRCEAGCLRQMSTRISSGSTIGRNVSGAFSRQRRDSRRR